MQINRRRRGFALTLISVALAEAFLAPEIAPAQSESAAPDSAAITSVVQGFADALQKGDAAAAMERLASDALIIESGSQQTRAEYEQKHLHEDMAMLKVLPMTRSDLLIKQEGSAAWATSLYRINGTFEGREINSQGAELMVLTKTAAGWKIRAIHWSNHAIKPKQP